MQNSDTPKVSLLVPICNVERYLRECLDSAVAQTLKDIEIICINDGSTDESPAIIREYMERNARVKMIDKANSGYGDSMNRGLDMARGKYVGILESDDFMAPDALEKLVSAAERCNADFAKANFDFYWSKPEERRSLHEMFRPKDCGKPVCSDESIEAVASLFEKEGSNAWFEKDAMDILPKGFVCPHCGKSVGFEKETDTLDGWFDSGSTHFAAMERDQHFWPATMYIEGLDQYRGWFQSSLLVAVGALGRGAPFKECVTHGWTVDGEGKAMHKSLGNGMDPAEIFNKYGADLLRLWAGSSDYHVDVRCSDEIFKQLSQNYLKFRNTCKFCLDNLVGFDPENPVQPGEMLALDKWAVTRLNSLIEKAFAAYDNYEFHVVSHMINDFCVVDLSSFYFDIIKDRLYCGEENGLERRSAQTAVWMILDAMTRMFAPILAFTCDEVWLAMPHRAGDDARNVLFNEMVQPYAAYALSQEEMGRWARIAALRTAVNGALEQARADKTIGKSLEAEVDLTVTAEDAFLTEMDADALADTLIVSQVRVDVGAEQAVAVRPASGAKCLRCWKVLPTVGSDAQHPDLCPRCAAVVKKLPVVE